MKRVAFIFLCALLGVVAAQQQQSAALYRTSDALVEASKRSVQACDPLKCSGSCIYCSDASDYFCAPNSGYKCCGCRTGWNGFQCGGCPSGTYCRYDSSQATYYACDTTSGGGSSLPANVIAGIVVAVVVFIVIVAVISACIRRRMTYSTVYNAPSVGVSATVSSGPAPYAYYAPPPVIVEPAPHYHHHHHSGGSSFGAAPLYSTGNSGGSSFGAVGLGSTGGSQAAVGFTSTPSHNGGSSAAIGFVSN